MKQLLREAVKLSWAQLTLVKKDRRESLVGVVRSSGNSVSESLLILVVD